ncbi:hypothetical protein PV10_05843 [Exophiala mesophila]|uniref:Palmitoyltransferase n=1 Tax=Exophiala mesophila TaxID=212818 RepID=A0A0D1ZWU2_EXOME|nr:uncharacterized protein PV10_05843 [Exophiala mesophila]KIV91288.1 hypothetical protein PV10_05843 [Exophiala mesophila]
MKEIKPIKPIKPMSKQTGNIVTARIIPVFLVAILGYASYAVTLVIGIDYLLNPAPSLPTSIRPRTGTAIAILTIYYLLLLMLLICLGRLLYTVTENPGLVPRGGQYYVEKERALSKSSENDNHEYNKEARLSDSSHDHPGYTSRHLRRLRRDSKSDSRIQAERFWHKDAFICGYDGRPPFCSTCYNYKPDRAHHCSELGRCVIKMDHFCPWVGGIISETSFKYFIQFTFWAAVFCLYSMIFTSYFYATRRREQPGFINVHWILIIVLATLFFLFTAGMCGSSLQFAFINSTTIENFNRKSKIWYVAVWVPNSVLTRYHEQRRDDLRLISYPRPPAEQFQSLRVTRGAEGDESLTSVASNEPNQARSLSRDETVDANKDALDNVGAQTQQPQPPRPIYDPQSASLFPPHPAVARTTPPVSRGGDDNTGASAERFKAQYQPAVRTFAILETEAGANPFDLGSFANFKQVMGNSLFDWLLPLRAPPLTDHSDPTGFYQFGPVLKSLRQEVGIEWQEDETEEGQVKGTHRSRRHRKHDRRRKKTRDAEHPHRNRSRRGRHADGAYGTDNTLEGRGKPDHRS